MSIKNKFTRHSLYRLALFVVAAAIIAYFFPDEQNKEYKYEIGKPWSYSLLTAPFDMPIMLDSTGIRAKKDSIDACFVPVYTIDRSVKPRVVSHISDAKTAFLLDRLYDNGIVDASATDPASGRLIPKIRMIDGNVANTHSTEKMLTVKGAYQWLDSVMNASPEFRSQNIASIIEPNITKDSLMTARLLNEAYQSAIISRGIIQQGERIIDRGEIVTPQTAALLSTYKKMLDSNDRTDDERYAMAGYVLIVVMLIGLLYAFFRLYRHNIYYNLRSITFIVALVTGFSVAAFMLFHSFHNSVYFIPLAIVPILIVTFFDSRTAFYVAIIQTLICSLAVDDGLEFILLHLPVAAIAINSLQELSKRSQLIRSALLVFVGYCLIAVALCALSEGSVMTIDPKVFFYFAINAIFLSFAYVLIFVLERLFGFTSKVTLVDLSDVNNPLLRELSEKCPGTFQHSMQLSNLVSEAAHEIGANTQLARAGALYHDIGKMENPAFFTENQHDVNPHELITPEQSAKIVIRHVADGLRIADKQKLPSVIKAFISEHHGKNVAKYFYTTACNRNNGEPVDPTPYTYPGPNPRSKETSILMMADATEAASRSLKEHTPEAITDLVNRIIDGQIQQGLMKDSPLSFRDVESIKRVFISRLKTIYHTRVEYPELTKRKETK